MPDICPVCSAELKPGMMFCIKCGTELPRQTATTPVQPGTTSVQPGTAPVQPGTAPVQPGFNLCRVCGQKTAANTFLCPQCAAKQNAPVVPPASQDAPGGNMPYPPQDIPNDDAGNGGGRKSKTAVIIISVAAAVLAVAAVVFFVRFFPKIKDKNADKTKSEEEITVTDETEPEREYKYIHFSDGNSSGNTMILRNAPGDSSTVAGKVSNGERVEILERKDGWVKIRTTESKEGWVDSSLVTLTDSPDYDVSDEGTTSSGNKLIDPEIEFTNSEKDGVTFISKDDACVGQSIVVKNGAQLTEIGIEVFDASGRTLGKKSVETDNNSNRWYFTMSKDLGLSLYADTDYQYRFYAVASDNFDNIKYSKKYTFTTKADVSVTFSKWDDYSFVGKTDATVGQRITVQNGTLKKVGVKIYSSGSSYLGGDYDFVSDITTGTFLYDTDEMGITLAPSKTYYYSFYAETNEDSKVFESKKYSFTTLEETTTKKQTPTTEPSTTPTTTPTTEPPSPKMYISPDYEVDGIKMNVIASTSSYSYIVAILDEYEWESAKDISLFCDNGGSIIATIDESMPDISDYYYIIELVSYYANIDVSDYSDIINDVIGRSTLRAVVFCVKSSSATTIEVDGYNASGDYIEDYFYLKKK